MNGEIRVSGNKWLVEISGSATENNFREFLMHVKRIEQMAEGGFCRLVIFHEDLDFSSLDFTKFRHLSKDRRSHSVPTDTRSAIVTFTQLHFGFARMWSSLTSGDTITIKAFMKLEEALDWLEWSLDDYENLKNRDVAHVIPEPL